MSYKYVVNFFKKYFKDEKKLFYKAFLFIFISSILGVLYGYLIGLSLDFVSQKAFLWAIFFLLLNFIFVFIDNIYFDRKGSIWVERVANNIMERIGYLIYYKVGFLPASAFEEKSSGELINRITGDSAAIATALKSLLNTFISLFTSFLVFIYILFNSKIVALEIILYLVLFNIFSKKFLPEIENTEKEIVCEKDKVVASVNENIRGIREIKALGIRDSLNKQVKNTLRNIYFKINKQMVTENNYNTCIMCLSFFLETIVFITCVILISLDKCSFAFLMSITYYIYKFTGTISNIKNFSTSYEKMKISIGRISEILDNKLYKDETFGNVDKTDLIGKIEFKNVTFKYRNEENNIFNDFNIVFPENKKIAIVGKSGQGKSSIFNLLLRYFEPNSGVILIDDIPIYDFTEEVLRQNIAVIRQEPFLFNKSILENLRIVNPYISLNKIRSVCKKARIDDYIMSLPQKYDTIIGEGGINLSGGQKQRLAIARALLKDSKIILLDEATSALDNVNQEKIKETLSDLAINHTVIMIAHRLSTIVDADIIFVIDKGKIVAKGKHKALLKSCDIYKELYNNES